MLLHPKAYLGNEVEIGYGTCIAPGTTINANVRIGNHCIVNVNASVSHDCTLGDFVNINPGAIVCGKSQHWGRGLHWSWRRVKRGYFDWPVERYWRRCSGDIRYSGKRYGGRDTGASSKAALTPLL